MTQSVYTSFEESDIIFKAFESLKRTRVYFPLYLSTDSIILIKFLHTPKIRNNHRAFSKETNLFKLKSIDRK